MSTPRVNLNKEIIALFSGQAATFTTPRLYVELTGSQSLGLVLNQIVFYSNKSKTCKDGWFYKPYKEWYDEILIPERTLRRKFSRLESQGLIDTKVKKVHDLNTLHIRPNMDRIIELISLMLHVDCPNRPLCPDGSHQEQKPCTKTVPTGHFDRSGTATLSDSSIDTDDYNQINTTNCESSSSFFFSKTLDEQMLELKLEHDPRTDEEFLADVLDHVENHSDKQFPKVVRQEAVLKLLKKEHKNKSIFYPKGKSPTEKPKKQDPSDKLGILTREEWALIDEYNAGMTYHTIDPNRINLFLTKEKQEEAKRLIALVEASKAKDSQPCQNPLQPNNARRNCSTSASSLVSHLG